MNATAYFSFVEISCSTYSETTKYLVTAEICNVRVFDYVDTIQLIAAILIHISKCTCDGSFRSRPANKKNTQPCRREKSSKTRMTKYRGREREKEITSLSCVYQFIIAGRLQQE